MLARVHSAAAQLPCWLSVLLQAAWRPKHLLDLHLGTFPWQGLPVCAISWILDFLQSQVFSERAGGLWGTHKLTKCFYRMLIEDFSFYCFCCWSEIHMAENNHCKVYNSVVPSTFTTLCSHHLNLVVKHLCNPRMQLSFRWAHSPSLGDCARPFPTSRLWRRLLLGC